MYSSKLLAIASLWALLAASPVVRAQEAPDEVEPDLKGVERVVAVGDVHGDLDRFSRLVQGCGLMDADGAWAGGKAVLVQTGDVLDRGDSGREALELLMRLESEAAAVGGRVVALLGNHEVMNLTGDLRFISPRELAAYAREETAERRAERLRSVEAFLTAPSPRLASTYWKRVARALAGERLSGYFTPGWFRHREVFSPEGSYGRWLMGRDVAVKVDGTLFLHGGVSPRFATDSFRALRERARRELAAYFEIVSELEELGVYHSAFGVATLEAFVDEEERTGQVDPSVAAVFARWRALQEGPVFAEDGLVWYRGLAQRPERDIVGDVARLRARQSVDRVVIGHTQPDDFHILARVDAAVILIDTGMNREFYGGHAEALEILRGEELNVLALE